MSIFGQGNGELGPTGYFFDANPTKNVHFLRRGRKEEVMSWEPARRGDGLKHTMQDGCPIQMP